MDVIVKRHTRPGKLASDTVRALEDDQAVTWRGQARCARPIMEAALPLVVEECPRVKCNPVHDRDSGELVALLGIDDLIGRVFSAGRRRPSSRGQ